MNTNDTLALQPGDSIEAFRSLYSDITRNVRAAAEMLGRLCRANPDTLAELSSGPGAISETVLAGFLKVAERSLHPALLFNQCPAYSRLRTKPYSMQEQAVTKGFVEVVTGPAEGDFIRVDIVKLEGEVLNQVLGPAGLRSLDEQRAWRRRRAITVSRPTPTDVGPPYEVKKGRIRILRGNFELTRIELLRLLETMEA